MSQKYTDDELKEEFYPKRYRYYGQYLRKRFGGKVFKVSVDAGFTCPNRDGSKGYGGCTYCNVDAFTPRQAKEGGPLIEQMQRGIDRYSKKYGAEKFIVYFQPNTNTYASVQELEKIYGEVLDNAPENMIGLTVGTRPDCMDDDKLQLFSDISKDYYVCLEYGMESISDDTLKRINRGHTFAEFQSTVDKTCQKEIDVCVHTIFGFPWENEALWLKYADELNRFPLTYVKLHHLYIAKRSVLAHQYKKEPFDLFTLESYTDFLCRFIPKLNPDFVIQRLFAISDYEDLVAPRWGLKKTVIQQTIEDTFKNRNIIQGSEFLCT